MSSLRVVKPGWLATIQDLGRYGGQHLGLGPAGAMDWLSCRVANLLVGNLETEAVLELMGPGGVFQADADLLLAVVGCDIQIQGNRVPAGAQSCCELASSSRCAPPRAYSGPISP